MLKSIGVCADFLCAKPAIFVLEGSLLQCDQTVHIYRFELEHLRP